MALWSQFQKLHGGWQLAIIIVAVLLFPITLLLSPVIAYLLPAKQNHKIIATLCALPLSGLIISLGNNPPTLQTVKEPHGTELLVQKTPSEAPAPSTNPYDRIIEIVQNKYGEDAQIFDAKSNMTRENAKPPFDVIVITKAHTCNSAKLRAWDITRDLYRDSVAAPAIGRVKVMVTGYVTTSLGSSAAALMNEETWKVGSSIFFKAVQAESRYETYSDEGIPLGALTFGVEQQGCKN